MYETYFADLKLFAGFGISAGQIINDGEILLELRGAPHVNQVHFMERDCVGRKFADGAITSNQLIKHRKLYYRSISISVADGVYSSYLGNDLSHDCINSVRNMQGQLHSEIQEVSLPFTDPIKYPPQIK